MDRVPRIYAPRDRGKYMQAGVAAFAGDTLCLFPPDHTLESIRTVIVQERKLDPNIECDTGTFYKDARRNGFIVLTSRNARIVRVIATAFYLDEEKRLVYGSYYLVINNRVVGSIDSLVAHYARLN